MIRFLLLFFLSWQVQASVYYVDAQAGKDVHPGTSANQAWKTLDRVNAHTFTPGDVLLFKAGQVWEGQLWLKGSGEEKQPIKVDKYGKGALPRIEGQGKEYALKLFNSSFWEISHLEITNYSAEEEGGISLALWEKSNENQYARMHLPKKAERNLSMKVGVWVGAKDIGVLRHIHLKNLNVHGVNGNIVPDGKDENGASKHNGGIGFVIEGKENPTWLDDVLIENCIIRDVDRTGLFFRSTWDSRTVDQPGNWTPSKNILIRKNVFRRTGANALIVRVAVDPVMEYNLFDYCAIKGSGNAAFSFNTDGALWQYNECRFTKANAGDNDAGGLDSDYRSKGTVMQYNYLHHNDFGLLVTGGGGSFNVGTVVRFNLIEEDGTEMHHEDRRRFALKVSGGATQTRVYQNTLVITRDSVHAFFHKKWKVWPEHTQYDNNLLLPYRKQVLVSLGESAENGFEGNYAQGGLPNPWFKPWSADVKRKNKYKVKRSAAVELKEIGPRADFSGQRREVMRYPGARQN